MIYLLQHASTLHSLVFSWLERFCTDSAFIQKTFVTILSSVNQSTLRHLDIPVDNADQVKMILSGLKYLFSVRFRVFKQSISREIREQLTKCTRDSSVEETPSSVSVWLGERLESQNGCKRIKLSHSAKSRLQEI
jgi:predicted membrane chloride channel (bestrophin family)